MKPDAEEKFKLNRTHSVVEVHGNEVYQRDYFSDPNYPFTPYYLVGACTSLEAAQAIARLLSM